MNVFGLLAQLPKPASRLPISNESGPFFSPTTRDLALIIGAALLVGVGAILWAVYLRRQSRRDRRSPTIVDSSSKPFQKRQRRRKRKESASRNPTLAETGGLPPVKDRPSNPMQGL